MLSVTGNSTQGINWVELQKVFNAAVQTALLEFGDDWRNVEWISSRPYILQESAIEKKAA